MFFMKLKNTLLTLLLSFFSVLAWAQPANDNCNTATNIGTLPTPGACVSGLQDGAPITLNNQSTVGATSPNPYVSLTGCSGGGNMASPALDTWYSFTTTGTLVNIAISGFPNASVGLWTGNCNNPTGLACTNIGGGGNGTLTVPSLTIGQTYYIQISGGNSTATDNNFSITIDNDIDCNDCLRLSTLTATPAPVNGTYAPGQVVRFCFTVSRWEQVSANWFHGVQIAIGPGWTGTFSGVTPAATCQNLPGPGSDGDWLFFPTGPGTQNGVNWGTGFYFDTPDAGTDPRNNFGDNCGGNVNWTFCWDLTVSSTCVAGQNLSVTVNTSSDGESGSWTSPACQGDPPTLFNAVKAEGPFMTSVNSTTICSGQSVGLALTANVPSTFTWVATANPNVTGESTTNQTGSTINNTLVNTTSVPQTVIYTVTPTATATGCPGTPQTVSVLVNPASTITLSSAAGTNIQNVCINTPITAITYTTGGGVTGATVSGLPAGVTGNFAAGVFTISGTPSVSGTFNYTVTTSGGCPPNATATGTITIAPPPTIALTSAAATTNQIRCVNTPITNITYSVGGGATGATVAGLPAGVTGNFAAGIFTISGTPTATGTFNYTVTTTGGCPPAATATGTITVNPQNTIAAGTNQTVCINTAITTINLATTGATGATFSGLPAGVTGTWAGNVATISGTPTAAGTFNYTVTTTGGCPPATTTGTITVNPQNTIAAGTNQTVCINTAITTINLATTGATGATFSGLPAGVTGSWAGNVATISGTPTATGTFNYTVTTTGGCPPATTTGTITVNPQNTIAAGTNQTVCINTAITTINLATTGATGATFSGLPAGVTGSWAGNVATISGTPTAAGTFNYTVTTTGGCPPATTTGTITVNPQNTIAAGTNQTVCINTAITTINLATTGATGATFSGLPAGVTGTWAGNVATISGTPTAAGTFNYAVTTTGGCPPATTTGTITVNPQNTIAAGTNQTVCINTAITTINLATTGATGATFSGLPAGVTGTWAGNVATISGTPTAAGTFNYTVTTTGGCPPATTTGTITVNSAIVPVTGFSYPTPVCFDSANLLPTTVAGFTTGGTFSSTVGLTLNGTTGEITVTSSTPGTYTVTYSYPASACGVAGSSTFDITITPQNTIAVGANQTVCINTAITTINLATTGATGATFSGLPTGVTGLWAGNVATISGTPTTAGTFNYTVTTTGGCPPATTTGTITVNPQNTIAAGTSETVCINTAITTINLATTGATGATFSGLPAGVTGSWAGNVATISGTPTAAGTFNYTVTTTGGCPPATTTGTITVNPQNTIAAGTNQTVCINTAITTINLATTGATGATFAGLPAGVTGSWAGNVATISGTPTTAGTFNYTVTTTGGCPPATTTGTITVNPQNTIAAGISETVCQNTAITTIYLATTGATGATFSGLPAGVTGSWAGNVATISGTPTAAGTFNYTVTTTGGCPPATTTGTITVNPQNTIAAGTNQTVCINTAITTINLATTGATGATFSGLPAGVSGTWAGNVATISGTPTAAGTYNYTVTTTGGCPPATTTGTITVNPQNTIAVGTSETVCQNTPITTINLATTGATGATFSGLPAGVTGTWAGNVATISGTPTAAGTFNYTVTTTGGCPPATTTGTIIVNPTTTPVTGFSYTTPVCINASNPTPITIAGFTTGGIYSSTAGLTIDSSTGEINLSTSTAGTYTVTYFYPATTCGPASTSTFDITINPLPTITLSSAVATITQTVCINSGITNIVYVIGGGATGVTIAGLPIGVTGNLVGSTYTISGTPTVSGTFNYTVTTTGGCSPAATATGTITVTPQNTIVAGTSETVCINTAITTINLATTGATGATFSGLPAGVTGSWAGNVATISGTPTAAGTFNYTVTTTGGCPPATTTGIITVTPQNTIAAGTSETVCINTAITTINLATTGATGATFSGLPAGVTGSWAGNVATISGTPTAAGTFNYTVTTTGGCPPATTTGTITVNPQNTIAAGTNQTVCINTAITTINLATTGATGATFSGLPAGVTGSWAGNVATISGTPTAAGTFNYTVTTTGGCPPATTTGTITVNPQNTIAAGTNQTVCINTAITTINLATTGATGATFSGLPAGVTGSWAGNVATISGTPTAAGTFNYTVTTTGGCPPATTTGTITVNPQNTIAAGTNQTVCINTAITTINLATTGATGATFSGLPAGVTGSWAGNVATISGTPTAAGTFNYTVTTTGGCPPATTTGTITVNPQNTIAAGTNQTVCINTAITTINLATTGATGATFSGLPAGVTGTWAGNVATISGTPTAAGTFNYTVTTTGGCPPATTTGTITVNPQNTIAAGTNQTVCINTAITTINLATTGATGATFSGLPAGVTGSWAGNVATISGTPTAAGTFNYTVTTTGGCPPATTTGTITVNPQNTIAAGTNQTVCINTAITTINLATTGATGATFSGLPAGVTGSWAGNVATISGTPTAAGTFNYTVTTTGGCPPATTTGTITVNPQNTIAAGTNQTVCINTAITTINLATTGATGATFSGLPAGVTGTWAGNVATISGTPTAAGTFNYTVTTTGGCPPATTTGTITVNPQNTIAAGTNQTVCINTAITTINLATTGATGATFSGLPAGVTGSWAGNVATISGTPTAAGTFNYTVTTTGGCPPATTTGTITVTPSNTIDVGINETVCINNEINEINLVTTGATGATFTGLPAGVTGTWAGNVATISGTPTVSGTFNYTVTTIGGCPSTVATGTIEVTPRPIMTASPNPLVLCNGATMNLVLNSDVASTTYTWSASTTNIESSFVLDGDGTDINQLVQLQDPTVVGFVTIVVIPRANNCDGDAVTIQVVVNPVPEITDVNVSAETICSNNEVSISVVGIPSGLSYTWQAINNNGVTIVGGVTSGTSTTGDIDVTLVTTDPLVAGTIQFEITPIRNGCTGASVVTPVITVNPIPGTPIGLPVSEICSGENANLSISVTPLMTGTELDWIVVEAVNITEGYATQGSGVSPILINDVLINETNQQGFIRYRVTSRLNGCIGNTTDFIVRVNPLPLPMLQDGAICVDGSGVTFQTYVLQSGISGAMYDFDWYYNDTLIAGATGNTYTATQPGTYSLIVTNTITGCISEEVFANVIEVQPATAASASVTDAFSDNATITVSVTGGTGTLLYQLDDEGFQESNVFTGVSAGLHTVTVIDTQGCTYLTIEVLVIDYPPFFTPNGDGFNDTWNIIGLQDQPEARIYIFDRYGKLLKQISPQGQGWDGRFNGAELPSTDYWFTVEYLENEQSKVFKAHFSLIR
jgi:gliding motility-associated-like protein